MAIALCETMYSGYNLNTWQVHIPLRHPVEDGCQCAEMVKISMVTASSAEPYCCSNMHLDIHVACRGHPRWRLLTTKGLSDGLSVLQVVVGPDSKHISGSGHPLDKLDSSCIWPYVRVMQYGGGCCIT